MEQRWVRNGVRGGTVWGALQSRPRLGPTLRGSDQTDPGGGLGLAEVFTSFYVVLRSSQGENRVLEPGPRGLVGAQNVRAGRGLWVRSKGTERLPPHVDTHTYICFHTETWSFI